MAADCPFQDNGKYEIMPSLVLGFHGCDASVAERVLANKDHIQPSKNDYDWLGHGMYFWEYSPLRAWEFAVQGANGGKNTKGKIENPAVVGAVIDPGVCLNLLEASAIQKLKVAYKMVCLMEKPIPENKGIDLGRRKLDCAVIEMVHKLREGQLQGFELPRLPSYDTVRGAFWEGDRIYPNAGFSEKAHVQICVRNPDRIKGYFRVL